MKQLETNGNKKTFFKLWLTAPAGPGRRVPLPLPHVAPLLAHARMHAHTAARLLNTATHLSLAAYDTYIPYMYM